MKNTPYTKKKIKNPIYELYNNLTKYLMEPSDELLNKAMCIKLDEFDENYPDCHLKEDIENFIQDVVINGNDYKKEERTGFFFGV